MIKTQEDFLEKYLPLTLFQGFEKVVWGFNVRASGPQFNQGSRETLRPGVAFPTTPRLQLVLELNSTQLPRRSTPTRSLKSNV